MMLRHPSLLLLILLPAIHATILHRQFVVSPGPDNVPDDFVPVAETLFLNQGATYRSIQIDFIQMGDLGPTPQPTIDVQQTADVLTLHEVSRVTQLDPGTYIFNIELSFEGMPGQSTFLISLPGPDGRLVTKSINFLVVGIVLFETVDGTNRILTGQNAPPLDLHALDDENVGRTVNASVFTGRSIATGGLQRQQIRVRTSVDGQTTVLLPWNQGICRIAVDKQRLDDRCSMAFSPDFTSFSLQVPTSQHDSFSSDFSLTIAFDWPGIKNYSNNISGQDGVDGGSPERPLENDDITSVIVKNPDGTSLFQTANSSTLTTWMIVVIVVTTILLVIAVVLYVQCCICGKRSRARQQPDVRGISTAFQQMGTHFHTRGVDTDMDADMASEHDDDNVMQYHVEAPSSPELSSTRTTSLRSEQTQLTDARRAHSSLDGVIHSDRHADKSVKRIVLPKHGRGVQLPKSHGALDSAYGGGNDDMSSYDMSSDYDARRAYDGSYGGAGVPEHSYGELHGRDPSYGEEAVRAERFIEAHGDSDDAERAGDRRSRDWSGVGAAINRVRQVDLLNGPVSAGLISSGEEVRQQHDDKVEVKTEGPMTYSTVS